MASIPKFSIVTRICGGLGNQLFQYTMGRYIKNNIETEEGLDVQHYLDICPTFLDVTRSYVLHKFFLPVKILDNYQKLEDVLYRNKQIKFIFKHLPIRVADSRFIERDVVIFPLFFILPKVRLYGERRYNKRWSVTDNKDFRKDIQTMINKKYELIYLRGFWQAVKYVIEQKHELKKEFLFRGEMSSYAKKCQKQITQANNAVCLHVRKRDYVRFNIASCSLQYYKNAISLIQKKCGKDLQIFVFSDDIQWCKDNLSSLFDGVKLFFMSEIRRSDDETDDFLNAQMEKDIEDFHLMQQCKHFVITNSTFSWWVAVLGEKDGTEVVSPKYRFAEHMYVKSWHVIDP